MSDIECLSQDIDGVAAVVGVSEQGIVAVWTAEDQIDLSDSPGFSKDLGRVVDDFPLFQCCAGKLVLLRIDVCACRDSICSSLGRASRLAHSAAPSKASTRARMALRSRSLRRISGKYEGSLLNEEHPKQRWRIGHP